MSQRTIMNPAKKGEVKMGGISQQEERFLSLDPQQRSDLIAIRGEETSNRWIDCVVENDAECRADDQRREELLAKQQEKDNDRLAATQNAARESADRRTEGLHAMARDSMKKKSETMKGASKVPNTVGTTAPSTVSDMTKNTPHTPGKTQGTSLKHSFVKGVESSLTIFPSSVLTWKSFHYYSH